MNNNTSSPAIQLASFYLFFTAVSHFFVNSIMSNSAIINVLGNVVMSEVFKSIVVVSIERKDMNIS